jgi:Tol biopolymer transport system component
MSIDRLERRLPEVLAELALPRVPDYVDDLLGRTERMPQRPGWTFLERWFPVSTIATALPAGQRPALRPLIAVVVLIALVLAAVALYVGSQHPLPPLFGLARNGAVVTADATGNIVLVDPSTSAIRTLVLGPNHCCATYAPDGQHITYLDVPKLNGDPVKLTIANPDGSTVRELTGDVLNGLDWLEWEPSGDRLLLSDKYNARIVDVVTGAVTKLSAPYRITRAAWIGTTGDILFTSFVSDTVTRIYRLPAGATDHPKQLAEIEYMVDTPRVSPDGSKFLYFIWGQTDATHGDLHVFDFATSQDTAITEEAVDDQRVWENPQWSPDGSKIAVELYTAGPNHVAVIPASGGTPVLLGKEFATSTGGTVIRFSPDGESLLVTYRDDGSTWMLPVNGAPGHQVSWAVSEDIGWQRLAR